MPPTVERVVEAFRTDPEFCQRFSVWAASVSTAALPLSDEPCRCHLCGGLMEAMPLSDRARRKQTKDGKEPYVASCTVASCIGRQRSSEILEQQVLSYQARGSSDLRAARSRCPQRGRPPPHQTHCIWSVCRCRRRSNRSRPPERHLHLPSNPRWAPSTGARSASVPRVRRGGAACGGALGHCCHRLGRHRAHVDWRRSRQPPPAANCRRHTLPRRFGRHIALLETFHSHSRRRPKATAPSTRLKSAWGQRSHASRLAAASVRGLPAPGVGRAPLRRAARPAGHRRLDHGLRTNLGLEPSRQVLGTRRAVSRAAASAFPLLSRRRWRSCRVR